MNRAAWRPIAFAVMAALTMLLTASSGIAETAAVVIRSGHVPDQDEQTWVQGSTEARPGIRSSGLPLQHSYIIATPGYWGDLGGGAFWISPSTDSTGPDGGYEYYLDFSLPDNVRSGTLDLQWRGNDFAIPAINGRRLQGQGEFRPDRAPSTLHASITPYIRPGSNRLSFFVWNAPAGFSPTGLVFQATITYTY